MKYSTDKLTDLIESGMLVLQNPNDPAIWHRYLERLGAVERDEAIHHIVTPRQGQQAVILPLDQPATRRSNKRLSRPRRAPLLWVAILVLLVFVGLLVVQTDPISRLAALLTPPTETNVITLSPAPTGFAVAAVPTLAVGTTSGELTEQQTIDRYLFAARAGDTVSLTLQADNFDPYLIVLATDDTLLAANDDCGTLRRACIETLTIPADGTYEVVIESFDRRSVGTYTLEFELISFPSTASATSSEACPPTSPTGQLITAEESANLRAGPATSYAIVGLVYPGECFVIIGRNSSGTWLQIRTPSSRTGWLFATLLQVQGAVVTLPIVEN
jgi:hypothetical protein